MRRLLVLVAVLVLAGVIRLVATTSSQSHSPKFTASEVAETARDIGRDWGEPDPTEISEVSTTYGKAARVATFGRARHREEPDALVYVIAMHGHFTSTVPPPPGRAPARNDWLTVTIDSRAGRIRETNLATQRPPLEQLGKVTYIARA